MTINPGMGVYHYCNCPVCVNHRYYSTYYTPTTTLTIPGVYQPKHRKPGPAR